MTVATHTEELALLGGPKSVTKPVAPWPRVDDEVVAEVTRVLTTESLCPPGKGSIIGQFEDNFARWVGRNFALATNGGTAALHAGLLACGVQAGDEVITTPHTWGASTASILHCMAVPIFADIRPDNFTINPASIERKITPRTRAILAVHIYGEPCDMDAIMAVAKRHGIKTVEDCAQAHGARYKGRLVGTLGDVAAFSFQASKNLTGGEGGMMLCDDRATLERAMGLATHPARLEKELTLDEPIKYMDSLAYNYRMHTLAAAIANCQLKYLTRWQAERHRNLLYLADRIADLDFVRLSTFDYPIQHGCYHVGLRLVPDVLPLDRDQVQQLLRAEGWAQDNYVGTPIYLRPRFKDRNYFGNGQPWALADPAVQYAEGDCPMAELACRTELTPTGPPREPDPELMDQWALALRKVARHADAAAEWFKAQPKGETGRTG